MTAKPIVEAIAAILEDSAAAQLPGIERARVAISEATPNPGCEPTWPVQLPGLVASLGELSDSDSPPLQAALKRAVQENWRQCLWYRAYRNHNDLPELHAGYFVANIVGTAPNAEPLMHHDLASIYLTVQSSNLFYDSHVHKAPELYNVVAGTGEWQKGDRPFEPQAPGTWIVHPSGTRHAMRSGAEPMLSLAIWTDDLDSIPVIVRD